jgi:hypothetical protein
MLTFKVRFHRYLKREDFSNIKLGRTGLSLTYALAYLAKVADTLLKSLLYKPLICFSIKEFEFDYTSCINMTKLQQHSFTLSGCQCYKTFFFTLHLPAKYHILSSILCTFYMQNDAEKYPAHYTWQVAGKGFRWLL